MVSGTYYQHGEYVDIILYEQTCTHIQNVPKRRMNPPFTSVIFDTLFTKHFTYTAYISRSLVRKFRIL